MAKKNLLSVAEISRQLEVPESTVHYWKNRFAQHLPSVGQGRQKRFKPEAVDVFRTIADLLGKGHTAQDVKDILSQQFAMTPDTVQAQGASPQAMPEMAPDQVVKMAGAIGLEIARSIGEGIRNVLSPESGFDSEAMNEIRNQIEQSTEILSDQGQEVQTLRQENDELKSKMKIMESELVRLRRDRREMEKYLLDKMHKMNT